LKSLTTVLTPNQHDHHLNPLASYFRTWKNCVVQDPKLVKGPKPSHIKGLNSKHEVQIVLAQVQ